MEDRQTSLHGFLQSMQWDKAWDEYNRLAQEGPPSALLLLRGSHAAYGRRDFFRARHLVEEALRLYDKATDKSRYLGQIRFHLCMVARKLGDHHVALEQLRLFFEELSAIYPDLYMAEGRAWYYLALTLRERRDYPGAAKAYRQAVEWNRAQEMTSDLCVCLQNLSWLLLHTGGDIAEARMCLDEAASILVDEHRVNQTLGTAYLLFREGRLGEAQSLCEAIFRMADMGGVVSTEEKAQAAWLSGEVAFARKVYDSARAMAEVALSYATVAKESRLMNDANDLRRRIYQVKQAGA